MFLLLLYIVTVLILDPAWDWWRIETKNQYLRYATENVHAALFYVAGFSAAIAAGLTFRQIAPMVIMLPSVRWWVHDITLNLLRGKELWYLGDRARTDRFLWETWALGMHPAVTKTLAVIISLSFTLNIHLLWKG